MRKAIIVSTLLAITILLAIPSAAFSCGSCEPYITDIVTTSECECWLGECEGYYTRTNIWGCICVGGGDCCPGKKCKPDETFFRALVSRSWPCEGDCIESGDVCTYGRGTYGYDLEECCDCL